MQEERPAADGPIIPAKITVPEVSRPLVPRPRLERAFAELVRAHRVVGVWATAGSGKTTAVIQGLHALDRPVAWLTLDPTDTAPGRLLVYLEAALRNALPATPPAASEALAARISHPEAAGILAQSVSAGPALLVIDELERIAESPEALAVVSGLLRYLDPRMRVVLVGRSEVELEAMSRAGPGAVGRLGESHLAFDADEAAEALALRGLAEVDARSVVEATGGWVTGVLFEAWRSLDHVGGSGGEADPLAGYLAAEILAALPADERDFLIVTSLFDEVDVGRAERLGIDDAAVLLARLHDRHLPMTWQDAGRLMRCHPRLREYLRSLLDRRDRTAVRALRRRYGLALAEEGRDEEAVVELLAAGYVADAAEIAGPALAGAIARLDLALAQGWLDRFALAGLLERPSLMEAQLRVAMASEEFHRAIAVADSLRELGALDPADPAAGELRALAAWAYWHVGRLDDLRAMAGSAPGHADEVIRYQLSLVDPAPPSSIPQPAGGPLDSFILRIGFARGRLAEVRGAPFSQWSDATDRLCAHRAMGELDETQRLLTTGETAVSNLRFAATTAVELMIDLGQEDEAREALIHGRERIIRSGSFVFDMISRLLAAKLELRLRRDAGTALTILRGMEATGPVREYGYLAEQIDLWRGCALLLEGEDEQARDCLRAAVTSMRGADRILELPTAAVYLAEAHWRAGDAAQADDCADAALEAAYRQGSRHLLIQALDDFPGVLARRRDAESRVDGVWHELGRSLALRPRVRQVSPEPAVWLRDIGPPLVVVGGEERRPRIAKTCALLAYLLEQGPAATRAELLGALFDGRADGSTRAYLRQAVHGLRQILPPGVDLLTEGDQIVLNGGAAVGSDTRAMQAALGRAAAFIGPARGQSTRRALEVWDRGAYLEGVECAWVEQRRAELGALVADAQVDLAVVELEDSRFDAATDVLRRVLAEDPYRERAWRLLMRVSAQQGLDDRVIDAYRGCEAALAEVGLQPSESTRRLAERLRR